VRLAAVVAFGVAVGIGALVGVELATPLELPRPAQATGDHRVAERDIDEADRCDPASVEERAGHVLVVGLPDVTDPGDELVDDLADLGVGGVFITNQNVIDDAQTRALIDGFDDERWAHRPVVTTDEEPGRVSSFGDVLGRTSSARTLGARGGPDDIREFATELGEQLADYGVDIDFAPVADLDDGPAQNVIGDRSFSADPEVASELAAAFSQGLADADVLPTAKHFPGHGQTATDTHAELATVSTSLDELAGADLAPFVDQIDLGVPLVMLAHIAFEELDPDLPASLSPSSYELLRELGFEGVAITDSVGMGAIHQRWDFHESVVMAIGAGADAVLATDGRHARRMRDALVEAVEAGDLDEERLDEAATRMLALRDIDPEPITCAEAPDLPSIDTDG
jgi:beta-N-acetylhexosaminidase